LRRRRRRACVRPDREVRPAVPRRDARRAGPQRADHPVARPWSVAAASAASLPPMQLDRLIAALGPTEVARPAPVDIADLAYDTRAVRPDALFFCIPGASRDGHDLAPQALEAGAAAFVVERTLALDAPQLVVPSVREAMPAAATTFFGDPSRELEVAGVTGTNGKTTTAFVL